MVDAALLSARAKVVEAARHLISDGRLDEADLLLDDVLAAVPAHLDALCLRASSLLARGESERAFFIFSELATKFPERADIVGNLGVIHRIEGRGEEARFCFERAVALQPGDGNHRTSLANILLSLGDVDETRGQIAHLLHIAHRQEDADLAAEARSLAARVAVLEDAPLAAEHALRQALALRPRHAADLGLLSDVLARLHRNEEALAVAEQVYLLAPSDHEGLVRLARCLLAANRPDEAERHLRRIVATAPHHVDANHLLAVLNTLKGDGARALATFGALVRRAPSDPELLLRMAMLVRLGGDPEKALAFAEHAVKQAPPPSPAAALRDEILLALGRTGEVWPVRPHMQAPAVAAVTVPLALPVGDVMLFSRFAARLAPPEGRIVCHAEPDLLPLLLGITGLAPTAEPAGEEAVPITDLPGLMGVGEEDLAAAPYLAVEGSRHARWGEALADFPRPLVGIVWDEASPGLTLDALAMALNEALAGEGTLVSLIFDQRRDQLRAHPAIIDAGAHFTDSRELVAAVAHLDLIVGSDGLGMHVAGALGRKAVIAVPSVQPWVWAQRDGRSLWYPTIQVARQPVPRSWNTVLAALASAARGVMEAQEAKSHDLATA